MEIVKYTEILVVEHYTQMTVQNNGPPSGAQVHVKKSDK